MNVENHVTKVIITSCRAIIPIIKSILCWANSSTEYLFCFYPQFPKSDRRLNRVISTFKNRPTTLSKKRKKVIRFLKINFIFIVGVLSN